MKTPALVPGKQGDVQGIWNRNRNANSELNFREPNIAAELSYIKGIVEDFIFLVDHKVSGPPNCWSFW